MRVADMVLLAQNDAAGAVVGLFVGVIYLAILVLMIVSGWKIFEKAGEPGWAAIVPIYNAIVFCRIAGKPEWWFLLFLIPCVGIVFAIMTVVAFAEKFGKSGGFAVGLILLGPIFYPILAFGDAQYEGRRSRRRSSSRRVADDEDDDDYESRRPRRRRDDDEDRPRRRRDEDDDDRPRRRRPRDDDDE